jgi:hypothetical protein
MLMLAAVMAALIAIAVFPSILGQSPPVTWFIIGGMGLAIIFVYKRALQLDWLSASVAYMVIFWIFHLGLVFPAAIVPSILSDFGLLDWLMSDENSIAVVASLLFLVSFALGTLLRREDRLSTQTTVAIDNSAPELITVGGVIVVIGTLWGVWAVLTYGVESIFSSYQVFFAISNSFSYAVLLTAYGLVLQISGGQSLRAVLIMALWSYMPVAVLTMLAGARTTSLSTAVVLVIVATRRGLHIPRLAITLGIVIVLTLTATIREVRQVGLTDVLSSQTDVVIQSPVSGLTELGGSLMPVTATIDYMKSHDFFWGETYFYPIWRQIGRLIGEETGTPDTDPRFIADRITGLYGAIGYSTAAEAYANGGLLGVIVFAGLWGVVFCWLERRSYTPYGLAIFAGVLIPMFINIRNSFIYVPAWIVLALLPMAFARLLRRKSDHIFS